MIQSFKLCNPLTIILLGLIIVQQCDANPWRGNYQRVRRARFYPRTYCVSYFWWWGCSRYRTRWYPEYYDDYQCKAGWTHNGDRKCYIPICRPSCGSKGKCVSPNRCQCDSSATGKYCRTLTCSYKLPCYPGECYNISQCHCETGFISNTRQEGCLSFDPSERKMYPDISRCTAAIKNVRRTDNRVNYMFVMDGTKTTELEEIWINQKRFNVLSFEFESLPPTTENLPSRPAYVYESAFGIVNAMIIVNITKVSRTGSPIRDEGSYKTYDCPGLSNTAPGIDGSNCTIFDDQFKTLIEHGDWMDVKYQAISGGFRELRDTDHDDIHWHTDIYNGLKDVKNVRFLFDFIAPKFCGESEHFASCQENSVMLKVDKEFTKDPIKPLWYGWQDDLSGMNEYYIEVFRLFPDQYGRLIERDPLSPVFSTVVSHRARMDYPEFTPDSAGIFSVLMEARDHANNSRIARRLVIFDDTSDITLNTEDDAKLYVSSADALNNYTWQTTMNADGTSTFIIRWDKHFINQVHKNGYFLNRVMLYPIQFKEIEYDGILHSRKYVSDTLDDSEGNLTLDGIENYHGIIKFEMNKVFALNTTVPETGWEEVKPLKETTTVTERIEEGSGFRIWIRAHDVMGHVKENSIYIRVDTSEPVMSEINDTHTQMTVNYKGGKYNFTTRINFKAVDTHSGVHKIGLKISVTTPGKTEDTTYSGTELANMKPADKFCTGIDGVCYTADQTLDLDNCWFLVAKEDLDKSSAVITVTAYNNAMLNKSLEFEIPHINVLQGLEKYSRPENFRIERKISVAFRVAWDLPDKISCYGLADIVLMIVYSEGGINKTETHVVPSAKTYFDLLGRIPNTEYHIMPSMMLPGGTIVSEGINMVVRTAGASGGTVAGVAVELAYGWLVIIYTVFDNTYGQ